MIDAIAAIASRKQAALAQIALAWLLAQKPWIVPTPSTTKLRRLEENIGAASIEPMSDNPLDIQDAVSKITVQGDRYSADRQKLMNRSLEPEGVYAWKTISQEK